MALSSIIGGVVIVLIPTIQIGFIYRLFWVPDHVEVDRKNCECSCFDAVFKGSYEVKAVKHGYKHVYFNATWQTMCVWIITVFYILLGYEALKRFASLFLSSSLRPTMAIVFSLSVYPHIYAWFAFFNYYNDDFYPMFNHQVILKSCDRHVTREHWLYSIIVGTALVHLVIGGLDQFVLNLFFNRGKAFQIWRDIGLATPDVINIIVPVFDFMKKDTDPKKLDDINQNGRFPMPTKTSLSALFHMKHVLFYTGFILILGLAI